MHWFVYLLAVIAAVLFTLRYFMKGASWKGKSSARGQTIVVTGANSGIGRALAEEFLLRGAENVVLACRSRERADKAKEQMVEAGAEGSRIHVELVDLMSFKSVIALVDRLVAAFPCVDVLVCNAGVLQADGGRTENGHEKLLQANYLGHFLLVEALRRRTELRRVVFVSSLAHKYAKHIDLTAAIANPMLQYSRAKLAEVCYARHLAGQDVAAYSCNPGVVHTNILAGTWMKIFDQYLEIVLAFIMKSPLEGAQTPLQLSLARESELRSGCYYSDCAIDVTHPFVSEAGRVEELHRQSLQLTAGFLS